MKGERERKKNSRTGKKRKSGNMIGNICELVYTYVCVCVYFFICRLFWVAVYMELGFVVSVCMYVCMYAF